MTTPKLAKGTNHCVNCLNAIDDHNGWTDPRDKYPLEADQLPEYLECPPKRKHLPPPWD